MATVNLGSIKFNWQGAYNGATAYAVDDVVSYNGSSYICTAASTGNLPTDTNYWDQMSAKGTDADLLNISGTVQGDIYYNNGSAIARLGAGTSGQVLQTGGTGANPSWTTVSSDVVKLGNVSASSAVSSITIDGYFDDSIYHSYKIIGEWRMQSGQSTTNPHTCMYFRSGNSNLTGASYTWVWDSSYFNGTNGTQSRGNWGTSTIRVLNTWNEVDNPAPMFFEATLVKPATTGYRRSMSWMSGTGYNGSYVSHGNGWMVYESQSTALSGLYFYGENGQNFDYANLNIYGVK